MEETDCDDLRLVRLVVNGEYEAYRFLVEKHVESVQRQMRYFARDLAIGEELAQDVFTEAYFNLHSYRGEAPFRHWLARIGTLIGYAFWRERRRRRRYLPLEELKELPATNSHGQEPFAIAELLFALLAELPDDDRLLLTLAHLEGCSQDEIALRTGLSPGTVGVRIYRARRKLQKIGQRSPWKERLPWGIFKENH